MYNTHISSGSLNKLGKQHHLVTFNIWPEICQTAGTVVTQEMRYHPVNYNK